MTENSPQVIQVTNISPNITEDQIKHFLEYIGRVREVKLYPEGDCEPNQTKVAYARYDAAEHVEVALHLTNTVMVDRALILVPYPDENIPDEVKALRVAAPMNTVAGMLPPTKEWPSNVVNMVCGSGTSQTIHTIDAKLIELGLPQYPSLPSKTDPSKIEEIRRTIYVSNLDPAVNAEQLVQFFSQAGEVMFARMAGDENMPSRNAYIEFTSQRSVPTALAYNGVLLNNRHLKVSHSLTAINNKPQTKGQEQLSKEIDEAMKKFKDVEHLIHAAAGANTRGPSRRSGRSKSRDRDRDRRRHKSRERRRSRDRRRSPSPRKSSRRSSRPSSKKETEDSNKASSVSSKERRRRSRSKSRDKKRSRSRDRSRRGSKDRKRSRSKDRKRERSKDRKRRSRSRDRSRRSRSRDRKSRRRSSSKDKDRKRSRDDKSKDKDVKNGVKVTRDYDAEEKDMDQNGESTKSSKLTTEVIDEDETTQQTTNGDNHHDSDSESDTNTSKTDTELNNSKGKNAMAELEKKAEIEAMDMDTGDDSDNAAA